MPSAGTFRVYDAGPAWKVRWATCGPRDSRGCALVVLQWVKRSPKMVDENFMLGTNAVVRSC